VEDPMQALVEEAIKRSLRDCHKAVCKELVRVNPNGPDRAPDRAKSQQRNGDKSKGAKIKEELKKEVKRRRSLRGESGSDSDESMGAVGALSKEIWDGIILEATIRRSKIDEMELQRERAAAAGDDDWSVVSSSEELEANDEVLARASELLGSALFESQGEEESKPTKASSGDGGTGTGTGTGTDPSFDGIAPQILQKYAEPLSILVGLGFVDKYGGAKIVETLERLTAASIGSGEDNEPITADAVIDCLVKQEEEEEKKEKPNEK
jgi:hypothetical protein